MDPCGICQRVCPSLNWEFAGDVLGNSGSHRLRSASSGEPAAGLGWLLRWPLPVAACWPWASLGGQQGSCGLARLRAGATLQASRCWTLQSWPLWRRPSTGACCFAGRTGRWARRSSVATAGQSRQMPGLLCARRAGSKPPLSQSPTCTSLMPSSPPCQRWCPSSVHGRSRCCWCCSWSATRSWSSGRARCGPLWSCTAPACGSGWCWGAACCCCQGRICPVEVSLPSQPCS
mmetsp:Transcript_85864/g.256036  ORF Transcript_85864/g.256036 Transcript_85864/m.256036 type:complete len:232 (+) Transcript_85864:303-998(+)